MLRGDSYDQLAARNLGPGQDIQARSTSFVTFLAKILKKLGLRIPLGRDIHEDIIDTHTLSTRSQPEIQARNSPPETVARGAADDFIKALLKSRDSDITPEGLLTLASLASRALDDLE
jgi:hypothetical protein